MWGSRIPKSQLLNQASAGTGDGAEALQTQSCTRGVGEIFLSWNLKKVREFSTL